MKRGQVSIEIILVLIFIIIFLSIFNALAEDTAKTLENSIILDQEKEIVIALNSFLKTQEIFISNNYNFDFNNSFYIPEITVPSKNVYCDIYITSNNISINAYTDEIITINKSTNFDFSKINFSKTIIKSCGEILECSLEDGMVNCE